MHANKKSADDWLNEFKVEISSASPILYGNGYQQTEIKLTANVQPGQPPLNKDQLDSLLLVLEKPDGTYEQLPYPGASTLGWWQSMDRDERFDLMPGKSETAGRNTISKPLYVSSRAPSGSSARLRARIEKDKDTVYYTDQQSGFDSYVTLTIAAPPIFNEEDYIVQQTITEGTAGGVFLHEHSTKCYYKIMVDSLSYVQKSILQSIPHIYFLGNLRDMKHDLD